MAHVIARRDGRFEIRESEATPAGPRSRTLATFRSLSPEVLNHAAGRARRPFDRARLEARANELGILRAPAPEARLARELIAGTHRGRRPPPVLAAILRDELEDPGVAVPDTLPPLLDWLDAQPEYRGRVLRDLLQLASRLPQRRRPALLDFPRINSTGRAP